jgi:hypothetical protein
MSITHIIGIDPGPKQSGFVKLNARLDIMDKGKILNEELIERRDLGFRLMPENRIDNYVLAIERIVRMAPNPSGLVFVTAEWVGRFEEAFGAGEVFKIPRVEVKCFLVGGRAKDADIRRKMIEVFGAPGTKKNPGPTHGVVGDVWQALAVAYTYYKTLMGGNKR